MLFNDLLQQKHEIIQPEFLRLFESAKTNQGFDTDLLLIIITGWFDEENQQYLKNNGLSSYVIGPGRGVHSELTHYSFIDEFRHQNILDISYSDYQLIFIEQTPIHAARMPVKKKKIPWMKISRRLMSDGSMAGMLPRKISG